MSVRTLCAGVALVAAVLIGCEKKDDAPAAPGAASGEPAAAAPARSGENGERKKHEERDGGEREHEHGERPK